MKTLPKLYILIGLLGGLFACKHETSEGESKEEPKEEQLLTEVKLTRQQFKAANLELGTMEYKNLKNSIKATGRLSLPPQNKASVSTPYGGIVKQIKVTTGQLVNQGAVLAIIDNPDIIQIQQEYLENAAQLSYLEAEYNRQKELQKDNINSQKTFQQAESEYRTAQAKNSALKAKLQLLRINPESIRKGSVVQSLVITAPISGYIEDIKANIGAFAEPNTPLIEIINNKDLHLDLQVFEKDVRNIAIGQPVLFTYTNAGQVLQHTATIFAIDKEFDEQTQAITVHAKIENPQGIMLPGMYVEARIVSNNQNYLSVPDEAIVSQGDEHFIFIVLHSHIDRAHVHTGGENEMVKEELGDEHTFRKVKITVGASDLGYTAITPTEEIPDDTQIVTKGAYSLLSAMNKPDEE